MININDNKKTYANIIILKFLINAIKYKEISQEKKLKQQEK